MAQVLVKSLEDAFSLTNKNLVERKVCLTEAMLTEAIDTIRGAVMICYPMGLPEVRLTLMLNIGSPCS